MATGGAAHGGHQRSQFGTEFTYEQCALWVKALVVVFKIKLWEFWLSFEDDATNNFSISTPELLQQLNPFHRNATPTPSFRWASTMKPSFEVLLGTIGASNQLSLALQLLKALPKQKYRPDAFTYSQAVKACDGVMEGWSEAVGIVENMTSCAVALNEVTLGALLNTQSSTKVTRGVWRRSMLTVSMAQNSAIEGNNIIYNSLLGSLGQTQWMEAVKVMETMASNALRPNAFVCSALLSCCVQAAKWTNALNLWLDVAWCDS